MQAFYSKAYNSLQALGLPVYVHPDDRGNFSIDAECTFLVDYYEAFVHPDIDSILNASGLFAEWVNPGRMAVYKI